MVESITQMKKTPLRQAAMKLALVACVLLAPLGLRAQETLTVYDGTATNAYVPMYGGYFDDFTKSEFVIPASELEEMVGGEISSIKFYISSVGSYGSGWSGTHQQVFLKEVGSTTLSAYSGTEDATIVFDGMFDEPAAGDQEFEIVFSTNYTYQGGNLLIGIYNTVDGGYRTVNWYGQTVTGASGGSSNGTALSSVSFSQRSFIPKTTFTYEPAQQGGDVCEKPATCDYSNVTATSATLTWGGGSGRYNVELKAGSDDWGTVLSGTNLTTTTLTLQPTTTYQARVQSVCDGTTPTSIWKTSTSFTTPCASYDIPYTYGFEDAAPFACWTVLSGNITRINGTPNTGSYRLDFRGTTSNMIALPLFNEATDHLRVEFWTRPESTGGNSGKFAIGYMTDIADASSFVAIETYNSTEMTTTYVKKTVDMVGVPANAIIAMRQFDCSTNYYWYVDDVTVKEIPSCVAPTGLAANPSTTSAELSWTANSGETAWTLYYKKAADANYTEVPNATNPYTLQGLQAATSYLYYVVANCAAEDASEPSEPFAFATECDVIPAVGYSENFDVYSPAANSTPTTRELPTCWNYINECTYSSYMYYPSMSSYYPASYAHTGSNYIKLYSSYSSYYDYDPQPQYAILPEMSELAGKFVTLWAKGYNATSTFKIGTMTDPADANSFVAITEQALSTSYQEFEYVIPANAAGHYLAIMIDAASSSRTSNGVYIDDIQITEVPTCFKPSALMLETPSARTAHTATLKWTNGEVGQEAWQIAYSTDANFDPDTVTPVDVTENPATISGLAQSTTYYAYVRANCGTDGYSAWNSTKATFTTLTGNVTPSGLAVDNATITSDRATVNWNAVAGNDLHEYYQLYYSRLSTMDQNNLNNDSLITTPINTTSYTFTHLDATTTYYVWVRDYCGADGYSNWSSRINFTTASSCQTPDGLAASNVTNNSATLTWNAYGLSDFNLQYRVSDEEWDDNNIIAHVNTPYTMDPILTGNTPYQVRVQAACVTDDSWSNVANFTTACDPVSFPWSENFDSWENKSVCWSFLSGQYKMGRGTTTTSNVWNLSSEYGSNITISGKALAMNLYNTNRYWAVTPSINITNDDAVLKVDVAVAAWSAAAPNYDDNDTLAFAISTDGGNTFTSLRELDGDDLNGLGNDYTTIYVPVAGYNGQTVRFAIYGGSISGTSPHDNRCVFDNVSVEVAPSCYPLGTLTHANVGTHSAELSWALVDDHQTAWQVQYATDENFTEGVNSVVADAHENYTLAGLTPEVHYWVRVRAKCGNDNYGDWSNAVDFTTDIACPAPTALTLDASTTETLTISWTGSADTWIVAYKEAESAGDFTIATEDATNPYTITGLDDGTLYTVKVRANCGNVNGLSQWISEDFQTEASCPAPTNLAVTDASETAHGARITWDGNVDNDSYTVEYAEGPMAGSTTLLDEDFESGSMPTGWTTDGPGTWSIGTGDYSNGTGAGHGTYNAKITHNTNNYATKLITPAIDLSGVTSPTLSYMHIQRDWSGDNDELRVYYRISSSDPWTLLAGQEYTSAVATWTSENNIALPNPSSTYQIAFEMTDGYGYGVGVDNVVVTGEYTPSYSWNTLEDGVTSPYVINTLDPETDYVVRVKGVCGSTPSPASNIVGFTTLEACGAPTAFVLGAVEAHQATFSWTAGIANTAWKVYVKEHGAAEYPVAYTNANTASVTIDGLEANTAYDVKIVPTCNESKILEVENAFTTPCEATVVDIDHPFTESFDVNTFPPSDCWDTIKAGTRTWSRSTSQHHTGDGSAYSGFYGDIYLILPNLAIADESADVLLKFWSYNTYTSSYDKNSVVLLEGNNETELWTTATVSQQWVESTVDLSAYKGQTISIAFKYEGSNAHAWYIDDVTVGFFHTINATASPVAGGTVTGGNTYLHGASVTLTATPNAGYQFVNWTKGGVEQSTNTSYSFTASEDADYVANFANVYTKTITANKWYAISSPVHNSGDDETLAGVTNLTTGTYDLFGFTESAGTWDKPTTVLERGKGYIYRAAADVTLKFTGVPNSGDISYDLSYAGTDDNIKGFNLVGNPYPQAANIDMDCYSLTPSGTWHAEPNYTVAICEAVLVKTTGTGNHVSFTPSGAKGVTRTPDLAFTVSNEEYEDVAYVRFDNGDELPKIGHLEPNAPALSIPVNGKQYAIANLDSDCESFEMTFSGIGDYTISASGEATYLHLIDKVTGSDIDLLSQPTYSFRASLGDLSSRFLVKLAPNGENANNGTFAFWNGNSWTIEGEGTLEAYDVMGRRIFAREANADLRLPTSAFPSAGVYILRLGGNSQKVVIK